MYENIHVSGIHTDMEEVILDETMVSALMGNKDMKAAKRMERELIKRFKKYADKPKFIELSKRLEALRDKAVEHRVHQGAMPDCPRDLAGRETGSRG